MNISLLSRNLEFWSNSFDNSVSESFAWFYHSLPESIQEFIQTFSALGNVGLFLILLGIILLIPKKTRKIGGICLVSVILTGLVNDLCLKNIFGRARPYTNPDLIPHLPGAENFIIPGIKPGDNSFPSGHTFQCFAAISGMMFLYIFDKEDRKFNLGFLIFFIIYGVLMAGSRVMLTHHYLTDVIAGATFGFATGIGGYYIVKYVPVLFNLIKNKVKKTKNEEE